MEIDKRILEELIYERVRVAVNLCQLVIFEQDLDKSIERVMRESEPGSGYRDLAREYIDKAWQRLQSEWHDMRGRLDVALDD